MIGLPLNCMQDKNIIVQISTFNSREVKVLYMNRMRSALSSDPDLANITRISLSMILQTLFVVTGCDYISFLVASERQHFYVLSSSMQSS